MADPNPVLDRILTALKGAHDVLDIGCGNGALAGALARRGFTVTGVDPQSGSIAKASIQHPDIQFVVAAAEALPFPPMSYDAAVFLNALHHVPEHSMTRALQVALGLLRPAGVLVIVEPLAEGSFFEAMRPVDDETVIRAAALRALEQLSQNGTARLIETERFDRQSHFLDLAAFLTYLRAADPARAAMIAACGDAVAQTFSTHAQTQATGYTLIQPMRIWMFHKQS